MFEGQEEMSNLYLFASIFVFFLKHLFSYEKHILLNTTDDEKKINRENHWGENELLMCSNSDVAE